MGWLDDLKSKVTLAQSVWSGETTLEEVYNSVSFPVVSSSVSSVSNSVNKSDVIIGGFNVSSEVKEFLSVDKSDSVAVEAYIQKKQSDGWEEYTPTWFEQAVDNVESFVEKTGDFLADVVEQKYGIDIPNYGSDEYGEESSVTKFQANLFGLVFPVGLIGLLFLL